MGRLSPRGSKAKGDKYEREIAEYLNENVFGEIVAQRAPLSGGGRSLHGGGSADITGTPDLWVEAKRTERFTPYQAMEQAERGIAAGRCTDMPVVISRRNGMKIGDSMCVMRLDDYAKFYRAYLISIGAITDDTDEPDLAPSSE
jgi:hypothetical protein